MHAGWNALAKSAPARPIAFGLIVVVCAVLGGLATTFLVPPPREAWPWLVASVLLHDVYFGALLLAYGKGDLSLVYPIARGFAPVGVALLAIPFAGEWPGPIAVAGIALASLGIIALSLPEGGGSASTRRGTIVLSVAISLLIILYTVVDGIGARAAFAGGSDAVSYVSWMFLLEAPPYLAALALWYRRTGWPSVTGRALLSGVGAGAIAYAGYAIVLVALSQAPLAYVSALRESSVLFAALIGALLLGEPFGRRRIAAAAGIAVGLGMVTLIG